MRTKSSNLGAYPLKNESFLVAQMVKNLPAMQEAWIWSLGWEVPPEKGIAILPGEAQGQRSLVA